MSIADKPFAKVQDFLCTLADVERQPTGPNEGYECCMIALETWAEIGKPHLGQATLNMHRRYFPEMGNQSHRALASALRGYTRTPPPIDGFSRKALMWSVVEDRKGPELADKQFGSDHAVGLSRCYAASVLDIHPGLRFGLGRSLAAITHKNRLARLLGGYLAILGADVMAGMPFYDAVHGGSVWKVAATAEIRELVAVGMTNDARPEMSRYIPVSEVCRMIGAFTKMENAMMCRPANERTYVMAPILAPLYDYCQPVEEDPVQNRRIKAVLTILRDKRLARLHGDPGSPSERHHTEVPEGDEGGVVSASGTDVLPDASDPVGPAVGANDDADGSAHVDAGSVEDVPLDERDERTGTADGPPGSPVVLP